MIKRRNLTVAGITSTLVSPGHRNAYCLGRRFMIERRSVRTVGASTSFIDYVVTERNPVDNTFLKDIERSDGSLNRTVAAAHALIASVIIDAAVAARTIS